MIKKRSRRQQDENENIARYDDDNSNKNDDVAAMNDIGVATLIAGNVTMAKESFMEALARCEARDLSLPVPKRQRRRSSRSCRAASATKSVNNSSNNNKSLLLPDAQGLSNSTTTTARPAVDGSTTCNNAESSTSAQAETLSSSCCSGETKNATTITGQEEPTKQPSSTSSTASSLYIYQREEYDEGMHVYKEALYLSSSSDEVTDKKFRDAILSYNLGQAFLRTRQHEEAKRWFHRALTMITTTSSILTTCDNTCTTKSSSIKINDTIYSIPSCTNVPMITSTTTPKLLNDENDDDTSCPSASSSASSSHHHVVLNEVMIHHNIAFCCYCLGENDNAMIHHQTALRLIGELGLDDIDLAASCNAIGILYLYQGTALSTTKSMEFLQLSCNIYRRLLGPNAVEVATCLSNIARVYFSKFDYESALGLFQEAMKIRMTLHTEHSSTTSSSSSTSCKKKHDCRSKDNKKANKNDDKEDEEVEMKLLGGVKADCNCGCSLLDISAALYNIGQTYQKLAKPDEAMNHFRCFRKLAEPLLGPNHRDVVAVMKAMACIHNEQGRHQEACTMLEEALKCYRASSQEHPLELALMLRDMGSLYTVTENMPKALACHIESLQIQHSVLGDPKHQSIMISLLHIAQTHKKMGCYSSALKYYRHLYNIQLDVFGPSSLEVAATLCSLGLMKYLKHDYRSSLNFYQEALRVRQGCFGGSSNNYDIAATYNSIALISFKMKLYETAKQSFIECIRIRHKLDGTVYHADMVTLYSNLATVYLASGEDKEAINLYQESIRLERKTLGDDHLGVAVSMQHLAQLHQDRGELELAYDYFKEALKITKGAKEGLMINKNRTICTLLNLLGNIHLMRAQVGDMMECFVEACRISGCDYNSLVIAGYTFYGISKKHPQGAAVA